MDYTPVFIDRKIEPCPYCNNGTAVRTNRYLVRCLNNECGRYY